jgi:exodeoxyribonuclease VII small subunit
VTASQSSGGPSYEQARDELTELVKRLESGGLTLEQSLQVWERGEALAALCEEWLEGARARLAGATARQEPAKGGAGKSGAGKSGGTDGDAAAAPF